MRIALRVLLVVALAVLGLPLLVLGALNTAPGQRLAGELVGRVTGGQVALTGLGGRFPDALTLRKVELRDAQGVWLTVEDIVLDWAPSALLRRQAWVSVAQIGLVRVARRPVAAQAATPAPVADGGGFSLPGTIRLDRLRIDRVAIEAPVAGVAASLSVDGSLALASLQEGSGRLALRRLDGPGSYELSGQVDAARLSAMLRAEEPAQGLAAALGGLPDLGALSVDAALDGPWSAAALRLRLGGGALRAAADGTLDLVARAADLAVSASAPAMSPRPDVSWRAVALDAKLRGTLAAPTATGTLRIDGLAAGGAAIEQVALDLSADRGQADLRGSLQRLVLPGMGLFASAPVVLQAHADLARAEAAGTLAHPLLTAAYTLRQTGTSDISVEVPALAPFAGLAGVPLGGTAKLDATATLAPEMTVAAKLQLGLTEAPPVALALFGPQADVTVDASLRGSDVTLRKLDIAGRSVALSATGSLVDRVLAADFTLDLPQVAAAVPTLEGAVRLRGDAHGPLDRFAATADLSGRLALAGTAALPVTARLRAEGLPGAPSAELSAQATLGGAPLKLAAQAARDADGALLLTIGQGEWKSARLSADLRLPAGATLPQGEASLRMTSLAELAPLLGVRLAGGIDARAVLDAASAHLTLKGERLSGPGAAAARVSLDARVTDLAAPRIEADLAVDGIQAAGVSGAALKLQARGVLSALGLALEASGQGARATMAARLDLPAQRLAVSALRADYDGETVALAGPAVLSFGDALAVDRLRLRFRQASLELAGRLSPSLDLTATLRDVPAELAGLAVPGLALDGSLRADARLTGRPDAPDGTVRVDVTGLRQRGGPGGSLPPARVGLSVRLAGGNATLDARADAGTAQLTLAGTVTRALALNLRAGGRLDLAMFDPLLAAEGRRARGRLTLDAGIAGTAAAPRVTGAATLAGGELEDLGLGVRLSAIAARITGDGERVVIESFSARAGGGSIVATGNVGLAGTMPVALAITARRAAPIQSDLVTTSFDADLTLAGELAGAKRVGGTIRLGRTEIRIPEKLAAQVAVLDVRRPGVAAPKPAVAGPDIDLDVAVEAPGGIFIRGRGLNAQLGGALRVRGTAAAPRPEGRFTLRRGEYALVGKTLTFSEGAVTFDGRLPIDPGLDFKATTSTTTTIATLAVAGTASAPRISLSSVPSVPQDEVLAQLLFSKSAAQLGPVELAQIAAALAQIAGVGAGGGTLDSIRAGLGLDRLSVGGVAGGKTGASVEAGRTVAEGVYIGARQSTSGSGTQATVEVDLYRGLKLQADIGGSSSSSATGATGSGGTGVGLKYEFEY